MVNKDMLSPLGKDHIDLRQILSMLLAKKKRILLIALVIFCVAICYFFLKPTQYKATVLLEIHHKQENSLGSIGKKSDENNFVEPVSLQIALIRSHFILEPVLQSLHLQYTVQQLQSHLVITELDGPDDYSKKMGIIQLAFIDKNPKQAITIINSIANIAQQRDKERKSLEANQQLIFLHGELPYVQNSLKTAEEKLNIYRARSGKIDAKLQTQNLLSHLSDINKQLETTRLKKMDMSGLYTQQHPFLIALSQKQNELEKERQKILQQMRNLPAADQLATNLDREVNVESNLYLSLLNKINEQRVITSGIISDIRILSYARVPEKLPSPNLFLISIASLIIGFILAALCILISQIFQVQFKQMPRKKDNASLNSHSSLPDVEYSIRKEQNSTVTQP